MYKGDNYPLDTFSASATIKVLFSLPTSYVWWRTDTLTIFKSKHSQRRAIISVIYAICDVLMIRFYSLFVVDDELLASPFVQRFNVFHDLTLQRDAEETVNFLLQQSITPEQYEKLQLIYDPHTLTILDVAVKSFKHQSLLTVTLIPKELGSIKIGFAYPQTAQLHHDRMKHIHSPLTAVSFQSLHNDKVSLPVVAAK